MEKGYFYCIINNENVIFTFKESPHLKAFPGLISYGFYAAFYDIFFVIIMFVCLLTRLLFFW